MILCLYHITFLAIIIIFTSISNCICFILFPNFSPSPSPLYWWKPSFSPSLGIIMSLYVLTTKKLKNCDEEIHFTRAFFFFFLVLHLSNAPLVDIVFCLASISMPNTSLSLKSKKIVLLNVRKWRITWKRSFYSN